jgi:predicted PurR-regulated permease PerM
MAEEAVRAQVHNANDQENTKPVGSVTFGDHAGHDIPMEQWLRLLIVVSTILALTLLVAVAVRLLSFVGHTLLIFSLGGLLAYALDPIVERARGNESASGKRPSRARTTLVVFAGIGCIVVGACLALSRPMEYEVSSLAKDHLIYEEGASSRLNLFDDWLVDHNVKLNLREYVKHPPPNVKTWFENLSGHLLTLLGHIGKGVVEGFIIALVALYFLIYCQEMRDGVLHSAPEKLAPYAVQWMDDVNRILGGFVRGQLVLALTIGGMAAALCLLLEIKLWLLIGLFVVVAALIPVVGPFIGAVPAVIAALLSPHALFSPVLRVVILVACFGVINEVGSKILYPKLVGAALGLHEVLVLFILLAGVEVGGLTGVLFAAPLTALSAVTLTQLYRFWQGLPPYSVAHAAEAAALRKRHPIKNT